MSRHRKVKALDYEEEYDDLYGDYEEDDDFDEDAFAAQYDLNSGIDLKTTQSNNSKKINRQQQMLSDEHEIKPSDKSPTLLDQSSKTVQALECTSSDTKPCSLVNHSDDNLFTEVKASDKILLETLNSDLTKLAIHHLDKHQWQLPLMEMDQKFRDKTYYRHYTDSYISSLRSKLGHFLSDNKLIENPMKYHVCQEKDNFKTHSRMFELLIDYYQSLGGGFFTFATPSPDEEIVIGCRLGTKVKNQKPKAPPKDDQSGKAARFEYSGKSAHSSLATKTHKKGANANLANQNSANKIKNHDMTIQESHTAEELDCLTKDYRDSLKIFENKKASPFKVESNQAKRSKDDKINSTGLNQPSSSRSAKQNIMPAKQVAKQLVSLTEKRIKLKEKIKRDAGPSEQDKEVVRKRGLQTWKEYEDHLQTVIRPRINLVVVGHVDAGKSTLVGHLLVKLGQITNKQMHRFEVDSQRSGKSSFKFAWALDETAEERSRGVTIDIALTRFDTKNREVVLLDAPGHVDFVPAVISGAAQADAALLVVDATRGEFETGFTSGGQTREHTFLIRSLGVKSIIVVVNKMDTVDWSWDRFLDIKQQLKPFLKQVGFDSQEIQFVVCSGLTGDNLVEKYIDKVLKNSSHPQLEANSENWKNIPTLLEAIDNIKLPKRAVDQPIRVCVTDVYKGVSGGVFLGGKIVSGKLEPKQKLLLLPPSEMCEIKSLTCDSSISCDRAFAGDIVTIVATGIDLNKYYRGCILSDATIPCRVTNRFQARIVMFHNASAVLTKGSPIEVHINGTFESGEVRRLISLLNKTNGELIQKKPRLITRNSSAIIQLNLARVVCCELYEDNKDLGRFMMRSFGKTIAAGLITKIRSAKLKKSSKVRSK